MKIKQPQFLQKIDRYLLLNRPGLFLIKIHWVLPFSISMLIFSLLLSLVVSNHYKMESIVAGLLSISGIFSVYWLVHAVRGFRSLRRHMSSWLCALMLTIINMGGILFWCIHDYATYNYGNRSEIIVPFLIIASTISYFVRLLQTQNGLDAFMFSMILFFLPFPGLNLIAALTYLVVAIFRPSKKRTKMLLINCIPIITSFIYVGANFNQGMGLLKLKNVNDFISLTVLISLLPLVDIYACRLLTKLRDQPA